MAKPALGKSTEKSAKTAKKALFWAQSLHAFVEIKKTQKNPKNFEKRY